jgi:hypothetical protein
MAALCPRAPDAVASARKSATMLFRLLKIQILDKRGFAHVLGMRWKAGGKQCPWGKTALSAEAFGLTGECIRFRTLCQNNGGKILKRKSFLGRL